MAGEKRRRACASRFDTSAVRAEGSHPLSPSVCGANCEPLRDTQSVRAIGKAGRDCSLGSPPVLPCRLLGFVRRSVEGEISSCNAVLLRKTQRYPFRFSQGRDAIDAV